MFNSHKTVNTMVIKVGVADSDNSWCLLQISIMQHYTYTDAHKMCSIVRAINWGLSSLQNYYYFLSRHDSLYFNYTE